MWYKLDENYISTDNSTGIYVHMNVIESEKVSYWSDAHPKLLSFFNGLRFDIENDDLLVNRSISEYEVKTALKNATDKERVFWFYRKFSGGVTNSDKDYDDTLNSSDTKQSYDNLITWMQENIPSNRVRTYEECTYASYENKDPEWNQQFDKWREDVREVLNSSLQEIIRLRSSWDKDGCGLGAL